ncbi:hypothetical protein FQN60_016029, partial [Etheostoma spectabile]
VEEGWWNGNLNGRSGLFPSNFVKELDATVEDGDANDTALDETDESGMESAPTPTSPQPASGNGVIAQPKKIRGVGFGDIFREGSVKLKARLPSSETEEKKARPSHSLSPLTRLPSLSPTPHIAHMSHALTLSLALTRPPQPITAFPFLAVTARSPDDITPLIWFTQTLLDRTPSHEATYPLPIPSLPSAAKPAHPNVTDSQRADGDSKSKDKEYCKVTFAFEATNEDELTIKEGDIIHILCKDTGEPGWWRGEIGGREGVFPDNFVVMVTEAEKEKPKKPPPPSKSIAPKPEVPGADKKPLPIMPEYKVDRPTPDHKPSKPAAPLVPPKKPVPPPGKGRLSSVPPKRPEKPLAPSPSHKHNGDVPSTRPKLDVEPSLPPKPKTLSGDWGEKSSDVDLMSFDELSSTSEKLSHPTANRPKMPGRRLPAQFGGAQSPNKEVNVEKSFKVDEEDAAKPKLTETRKPSTNTLSQSPSLQRPTMAKPSPAAAPSSDSAAQGSKARLEPEEPISELDELKGQMKDLLLSVELLKAQQIKEISELRGELDEERLKRVSLQMEIEKLKRSIHSTLLNDVIPTDRRDTEMTGDRWDTEMTGERWDMERTAD